MSPEPVAPSPEEERKNCDLRCPPEWTGHWSEWHRGHGCKQEIRPGARNGAPSPEDIAREIVRPMVENANSVQMPVWVASLMSVPSVAGLLTVWRTRLYLAAKIEGMQEAHYECEPNGYDCGCANAVYLKLAKIREGVR